MFNLRFLNWAGKRPKPENSALVDEEDIGIPNTETNADSLALSSLITAESTKYIQLRQKQGQSNGQELCGEVLHSVTGGAFLAISTAGLIDEKMDGLRMRIMSHAPSSQESAPETQEDKDFQAKYEEMNDRISRMTARYLEERVNRSRAEMARVVDVADVGEDIRLKSAVLRKYLGASFLGVLAVAEETIDMSKKHNQDMMIDLFGSALSHFSNRASQRDGA